MQKEWLRDRIIEAIHRLDYFNLQKLSAFIAGLKSMKAQGKEGGDADYEDG